MMDEIESEVASISLDETEPDTKKSKREGAIAHVKRMHKGLKAWKKEAAPSIWIDKRCEPIFQALIEEVYRLHIKVAKLEAKTYCIIDDELDEAIDEAIDEATDEVVED